MSKAIIDFEKGDISALQQISDKLQAIIDKEGAVGEAWRQTSADMNTQSKTNVDSTNKLAQSIDQLAVASKSMDKVVIGGAYKNYLAQIQQTLGLTSKELIAYIQNARNAAKEKLLSAGSDDDVKQLTLSIQVMNDTLKQMGVNEEVTITKTQSLRTQIQNTKNELVAMAEAGLEGTPAFVALQQKAGQLDNQMHQLNKTITGIGSDTRNIDGLISLASGVAGGYAVAQGAAALFGDQNNEVAQALLKVNAAMSILQGLQQVQQVLQKESGASILLESLFRKQDTAAITEQTDAILLNNKAKEAGAISEVTGAVQVAKETVESSPVDANAAANTAAVTKNTAAVKAASVAEKEKAAATNISTASTEAQTVSTEANTAATDKETIAKGAEAGAIDTDTASTAANSAVKETNVVATQTATAATKEFTVALLENPVTAVVVGVLALVTAIEALNSANHNAEILQRQTNDALEDATIGLDADTRSIDNYTKVAIAQAQLRGASAVEISKIQGDANIKELANIKAQSDALGERYNKEISFFNAVYEAGGKIDKETLDAHAKLLDEKNKLDAEYADKAKALQAEVLAHQKLINDENFKSYNAYVQTQVAAQIAGTDAERNAQIASIRQIAAARESDANFQALTAGEKALARANDEKQIQALQLQNYQHYLKGKSAALDAELAIEKAKQATSDAEQVASINKITDLQIASIRKAAAEQIKGNPTLNAGEIQKINDEANLAIVEAEKKKQQDILAIQKNELTLQLAATEKGSYEEFIYNLALIENERLAEVAAAGKNKDLIKAIDDKYRKEKQDADNAFNQAQLNNEISRDNAALANFRLTEQEKLPLTLKRLDDQQALEISQANGNAAKIAEIEAKYDQQRLEAVKASIEAQLKLELEALTVYGEKAKSLNESIVNNTNSPATSRNNANDQLLQQQQQAIDAQRAAYQKELADKVITYEQYLIKIQDLDNQEDANKQTHSERAVKIFSDEIDKKLQLIKNASVVIQNSIDTLDTSGLKTGLTSIVTLYQQIGDAIAANQKAQAAADQESDPARKAALQAAADAEKRANKDQLITAGIIATQNTINQLFADAAAQRQQQLNDDLQGLEDQKNAELNNANLTAKQKDEINQKYAAKEKALKISAYKADKEAKKEEAIVNGFLAVTNALATVHPFIPAGLIAAGIAAASAAIQVAAIASSPIPKFRHGVVDLQGPGTSTSDSIPAMLSKGETVIPAEPTAKWKDALIAMKNDHFEDYLSRKFQSFVFPHIPDNIKIPTVKVPEIDYEKLATMMAEKMKAVIPPSKSVHVNVDKNGIHTIVKEANSKTAFKNKRYSTK